MSVYHLTQPDMEPVEFTHFDCWDDDTTMEGIVQAWEQSLGVTLQSDSWEAVIVSLLNHGFDVYEGDGFIEIYLVQGE